MGPIRPGLQLRVELACDKEPMARRFDDLHEMIIRRDAAGDEAGGLEILAVSIGDLITMPVALVDEVFTVQLTGE